MVRIAIAMLPVLCLIVIEHDLMEEGWMPWRSIRHIGILLALIAGVAIWVRHFLWSQPQWEIAVGILSMAILWKSARVDWVVLTDYEYMGTRGENCYIPISRPLWSPPTPQNETAGGNSWREFFYQGGAGGPVGEPVLNLNGSMILLKVTSVTLGGYLSAWFVGRVKDLWGQRKRVP